MRRWGWFLGLFILISTIVHAADEPIPVHIWANGEPITAKCLILNEEANLLVDIKPVLVALGFSVHRAPGSGELSAQRDSDELSIRAESRWGRWKGKRIEFTNAPLLKGEAFYVPLELFTILNIGTRNEYRGDTRDLYIYDYLPKVATEYHAASFWINRLQSPDILLTAPKTLPDVNRYNYRAGIYTVWEDLPETILPEQWSSLARQLPPWDHAPLYDARGNPVKPELITGIRENMNLPVKGQSIQVVFGLTVQECLLRGAPRDDIYTATPGSLDFDELQVSSLEIGSGVAVVGSTLDGAWLLVDSPFGWGWVEREFIAIAPNKQCVKEYYETGNRLVVVGDGIELKVSDKRFSAQMGADFPILRHEQGVYIIKIPQRSVDGKLQWTEGRVPTSERVREGFLPFTRANVVRQSLKLIGGPYAWGDRRRGIHGRDCSRFVADVFRSMGVVLPRNSYEQDRTGATVLRFTPRMGRFERVRLLSNLTPCGTILTMKGHIMIYLGTVNGVPYAIHTLYAYRTMGKKGETRIKTNRVVISRLDLGENTSRRSLLERLVNIVEVGSVPSEIQGSPVDPTTFPP